MKLVTIYPYQVGLKFKDGNYCQTLTEGKHWLWPSESVKVYDLTKDFVPPCELNILTADLAFQRLVDIVEIRDNEIALQYLNGNFRKVLTPGRYAFWKSVMAYEHRIINLDDYEIAADIDRKILQRSDVSAYMRVFVVEFYEEGLLYLSGKLVKQLGPGVYYYWKNEQPIAVLKTDLRHQLMEISGQEILTKDKAAIRINFYAQYKIVDLQKAVVETKELVKQLYIVIQLAIREYVGTMTLDELLANKESVAPFILKDVAEKAVGMGATVSDCGIRDIILPGDVKDIMNQVLVAEKKAQANIITRREETASTRSLLNTAKLMEENEMLFKLKEMEYVEKIAEKINSISVSGGGQLVEQLRQIFTVQK
ncbi:MAG: slipin family protein [Bacteroidetes bacterium]|nr:slipin family protein [Bacteroidota bacterium]